MGVRFIDSADRIRLFLRDPDALIWSDSFLLAYWNRALVEMGLKTNVFEQAAFLRFPQHFTWAISHEWERSHADGDVWQPWQYWEGGNIGVTFPWEASYTLEEDAEGTTGYFLSQPWEAAHGTPHDILPVKVPSKWTRLLAMTYDRDPIDLVELSAISDPYYRTREGDPTCAYWWDKTEGYIGLYPRPVGANYDDVADEDVFADDGGLVLFDDAQPETSDAGRVLESVDDTDSLFLHYIAYAQVSGETDEIDIPSWAVHYLECAVLEMAYGADTDGYIPSLRDYWKARKDNGYAFLQRLKTARMKGQKIVRGGAPKMGQARWPRLPSGYPEA